MSKPVLSKKQSKRLSFIEQLIYVQGFVNREDLQERFGISTAAATNTFSLYNKIAGENLSYNVQKKQYEKSASFRHYFYPKLLYERIPLYTLPKLSEFLINDPPDNISTLSVAIQNTIPLQIAYSSASSGTTSRQVVPVAIADTLLRWHLRAYDRKKHRFSDFVLHRIKSVKYLSDKNVAEFEHPDKDEEWHKFVKLEISTHPKNLKDAENFEMGSQQLEIGIRAAMAGYFLQLWNVDCSSDASLVGEQYLYKLNNVKSVSNLADLTLAPGYK